MLKRTHLGSGGWVLKPFIPGVIDFVSPVNGVVWLLSVHVHQTSFEVLRDARGVLYENAEVVGQGKRVLAVFKGTRRGYENRVLGCRRSRGSIGLRFGCKGQ